ncbi:hypothetical protein IT568_02735 [bacterium]|nr:hypothetical protein [bacterium]
MFYPESGIHPVCLNTDTVQSHLFNQNLSFQRAKEVVNFWKDGVSGLNSWWDTGLDLFPAGFGETRLRAKTPDNTPNAQNRRIEIRVVPKFNEILKDWTQTN